MLYNKNRFQLDRKHIDLSNAKQLDYHFLGQLIERTSFIETLILPKINKNNAQDVLEVLNESTAKNTTLTQIKLNLSGISTQLPSYMSPFYERIQSRLSRNRKRIFAIHGGGNIGLGCMADIVSRSTLNYTIKATSSDQFANALINSAHRYCLQNSASKQFTACVQNVHMVYSRDPKNIEKLYTEASLLALCLTEDAFLQVASQIAQGLIARYERDAAELKILILMNKPNCERFVRNHITNKILTLTKQTAYAEKVLATVKFIPTVVDRMVSKINRKGIQSQLKLQLVSLSKIHSDKFLKHYDFIDSSKPFADQIDSILTTPAKLAKAIIAFNLQFALFNVEENFTLHVPDGLPEARRLPMLKPVKNLAEYEAIKNKYINGPHAILAWAGGLMGCRTIAEAIKKPSLLCLIKNLMENEIAPILTAEYPTITNDELQSLKVEFIRRCETSFEDPISRVARDPLRKLIRGGRVRGVIELCQKHQLKLATTQLEKGIAAGILYAVKNIDPTNEECQKIREIYMKHKSYEAILCYKGPYGEDAYPGFDPEKDKLIIKNILRQISVLEKSCMLSERKTKSSIIQTPQSVTKTVNQTTHLSTSQFVNLIYSFKKKMKWVKYHANSNEQWKKNIN